MDFLFKPIVPEVLRSKVAVFVELFRKTGDLAEGVDQPADERRHQQSHQRKRADDRTGGRLSDAELASEKWQRWRYQTEAERHHERDAGECPHLSGQSAPQPHADLHSVG